ERQLHVVRWGLVPYWAKDRSIGSRMINARAETVADKPAFRRAFARRRCLLPADGFYEWQQVTDGGGKRKQPYYIYRTDGGVLAFSGTLTSYPVSTAVNNVRNNGPELREPLPGAGTVSGRTDSPGSPPGPSGARPPGGAPARSGGTLF